MKIKLILFSLLILLSVIPVSAQTTYYVCADTGGTCNASDSNAGTSKTATWFHAPGMTTFTGSYTHHTGDSIIFRGGDTWHFGNQTLNPHSGFQTGSWVKSTSGSGTSCNLNAAVGAIVTTSCDYIGVDQTWFNSSVCGASWCRPIMNLDNPVTTSIPGSCTYDYSTVGETLNFTGSDIILDNFEWTGACYNSAAGGFVATIFFTGNMIEAKNNYQHGFTLGAACANTGNDCDTYNFVSGIDDLTKYQRFDHNVFDNSDGTLGNSTTTASMAVFNQSLTEADHNVTNHISNGLKSRQAILIHDNLFQNTFQSSTGTHANIVEWSEVVYNVGTYYYNNLTTCPFANSTVGESVDMWPGTTGKNGYIFNNISNCNYNGGSGGNCYLVEGDKTPGNIFFLNNTTWYPCLLRNPNRGTNTVIYQNNQFINIPSCPTSGIACAISNFSGANVTATDNGNEVWQITANACGNAANNFAPTSGACATVGAGANLSSICSGMDNPTAALACASSYGGVTYNVTNHAAVDNTPVARGSSWDAGAYQFGGTPTAGTPTASPVAGSYSGTQNVTFSVTGGAPVICVAVSPTVPATNGTSGCTSGTLYTSPVPVSTSQTLKAIAGGTGFLDGSVGTFAYTITVPAGGVQAPANLQATANVQIQ